MKIVFISNFYHHMWKSLSEELDRLTNGSYTFISTSELPESRKQLGFQQESPTYVLNYNEHTKEELDKLILEADAVIIGASSLSLIEPRLMKNKLTFRYSERLYKTRSRYLKYPVHLYRNFKTRKCFLLCSGAFVAKDFIRTGGFKGRCYKWGYFPEVITYPSVEELMSKKSSVNLGIVTIVWAARLIPLKHPEMAVEIAKRLKAEDYKFILRIIGNGPMESKLREMIKEYGLDDCVQLMGSMPPFEVRKNMEGGDIFLMTSNRQEGWGAVVNESMNSGCAVVAAHNIGSVPFLINNGVNGLCFKSESVENLYEKVKILMDSPHLRKRLGENAYSTMINNWDGKTIASNLLKLINALQEGKQPSISEGPCSIAPIIKDNWLN